MHTETAKLGSHTGISKCFWLLFLFQALVLCTALSEQLYNGAFSSYFSALAIVFTFLAVTVSIPATVAVAVPENHLKRQQEIEFILSLVVVMCSAFFIGPNSRAVIELPFVGNSENANALGSMVGVFLMMSITATIRLFRESKEKIGAAMLLVGMYLASMCLLLFSVFSKGTKATPSHLGLLTKSIVSTFGNIAMKGNEKTLKWNHCTRHITSQMITINGFTWSNYYPNTPPHKWLSAFVLKPRPLQNLTCTVFQVPQSLHSPRHVQMKLQKVLQNFAW